MSFSMKYLYGNLRKITYWSRASDDVRYYLNRALWECGFPWTKLKPEKLDDLFQDIDLIVDKISVIYPFLRTRDTSIELDELIVILLISRFISAKNILEIGTFDGNTALNLAVNVGDDGKIVTVNLPPSDLIDVENCTTGNTSSPVNKRCFEHSEWKGIEQLYGDSAVMDWSSFGGEFDLIFIDGDHTSKYVRSDTQNALSVLRPGGVILWHDYEYKAVSSVIDSAIRQQNDDIHWIKGTRLAVGVFDSPELVIERFNK